jgi:hypothetical protein
MRRKWSTKAEGHTFLRGNLVRWNNSKDDPCFLRLPGYLRSSVGPSAGSPLLQLPDCCVTGKLGTSRHVQEDWIRCRSGIGVTENYTELAALPKPYTSEGLLTQRLSLRRSKRERYGHIGLDIDGNSVHRRRLITPLLECGFRRLREERNSIDNFHIPHGSFFR